MKNKTYTVEWSEKQQCFHVDTLDAIMQKNTEMFINKINNEFSLLGLFNSHEAAHEFVRELRANENIRTFSEQLSDLQ